jgi:hypothetical protein
LPYALALIGLGFCILSALFAIRVDSVGFPSPLTFVLVTLPIVCGWALWIRRATSDSLPFILSSIGLVFCTAAALLAVWATADARFVHSAYHLDSLAYAAAGSLLCIAGLVLGISGVSQAHPLRWHTPLCAVATLVLWWLALSWLPATSIIGLKASQTTNRQLAAWDTINDAPAFHQLLKYRHNAH